MGEFSILQPGDGSIPAPHYLPATSDHVLWGRLPCSLDRPVLAIEPGDEVTIDTISHEGLLDDQGRDPVAYFGSHGVDTALVLADAIAAAASELNRSGSDGPHIVTGPILVRGAAPGDPVKMTVLETVPRVPYGVISNRHGRGALPGEMPLSATNVSIFTPVAHSEHGELIATLPLAPGGFRSIEFPLRPFLGIMGVAVATEERPHSVPPGAHGGEHRHQSAHRGIVALSTCPGAGSPRVCR
jgi:acetamidase/formamidase